jgi:hypothetical protein
LVRVGDFFPRVADDQILPILSEPQKVVWRKTLKVNSLYGFELDWYQVFEVGDEVWPAAAGDKK